MVRIVFFDIDNGVFLRLVARILVQFFNGKNRNG